MIFSHSCPNGWRQYYKCKNKEETWLVPNSYRWYNFFLTSFLKRAICYMIKRVPLSSKFRKFSLNKYKEAKIYLFLFDFSPLVSQKLWYLIYFIFPERESMELFSEHILKKSMSNIFLCPKETGESFTQTLKLQLGSENLGTQNLFFSWLL